VSSEKVLLLGYAFLIFVAVITVTWLVWSVVNWVLSVACIFVITHSADTLGRLATRLLGFVSA